MGCEAHKMQQASMQMAEHSSSWRSWTFARPSWGLPIPSPAARCSLAY